MSNRRSRPLPAARGTSVEAASGLVATRGAREADRRDADRRDADRRDAGSVTLEVAILVPALLALLILGVLAGRVTLAGSAVDAAAKAAARAATSARTPGDAQSRATAAAGATLSQQGLHCASTSVTVDTSGFAAPVGTAASVTATVTCRLPLGDLAAPGLPNLGTKSMTSTFVSPLDTYRARG
ncbi:TadE/TadG family type IV pilus assembly protein [Embleya sp. MST-111070]|uniref:TadE/TadG family type IV pilus assembly protein n=1 Tax=Embleya sp. MST-111070 TaxID=3398231 RepID=UPI003F733500